jgi:hypothetical protein
MKEIRVFQYNPMNGTIWHTSASGELDAISVIAECRILRTL